MHMCYIRNLRILLQVLVGISRIVVFAFHRALGEFLRPLSSQICIEGCVRARGLLTR
jgi:hypothetical protein